MNEMKIVRLMAGLLYFITKLLAWVSSLIAGYYLVIMVLAQYVDGSKLPLAISGESYVVFYPFTKSPFLIGEYNGPFIISSLVTMVLYSLFLWFLTGVFNAFRKDRLFTQRNVRRLSRFYRLNFIGPVGCIIVLVLLGWQLNNAIVIALLHVLAGVFAFFMAAIFKEGLILQEEQDLTL
jgi:hypothetical protein